MINYQKYIASKVQIEGFEHSEIENSIVLTQDGAMGDFSLPCFKFAKALKKSPQQIAEKLAQDIKQDNVIAKTEAKSGYLNVFLNRQNAVLDIVAEVAQQGVNFGSSDQGRGKTICIDYSSVNIAKSLHIGHLGTTAIGNALKNLFTVLGYKVVGINHLGDYGTQFGKLIVAYKLWGDDNHIKNNGAKALQEIYVKFHSEAEEHPELISEAREWFVRIENNDTEAQRLFNFFKEVTLADVCATYKRLNVEFDSWDGESFFNDKMEKPLEFLAEKGLLTQSEGATVVDLSEFNMPPCLLKKSDGSSLYATRDIAAAFYRKQHYDFDKCLYVVAYQQDLHFKQIFKVLQLAELPWADGLVHVSYGMVSLEEGAMSTRKGNTVFLNDVLDMAVRKALDIICQKNPDLVEKEQIAEQVGVGAVIFSALENARIKDITFTFDRVLNFDGETAPYLQYTYARCCSLFEKANTTAQSPSNETDKTAFDNAESLTLAKLLSRFPSVISDSAARYEPSLLSNYLIDLAQAFNKFYFEQRILSDNKSQQNARLKLVFATQVVLKKGLAILGIQAPTKM